MIARLRLAFGRVGRDLFTGRAVRRLAWDTGPRPMPGDADGRISAVPVEEFAGSAGPGALARGLVDATGEHRRLGELLRHAGTMQRARRRQTRDALSGAFGHAFGHSSRLSGLRTDLRHAVAREELFVHYQPVCDPTSREIAGFEALLRWRHPVRGLVPPDDFIGLAEETGLIGGIGRWVLREACAQMVLWRRRHPGLDLTLNVNISGRELGDRFASSVGDILLATGLDAPSLQLEVTESVFLHDPERVGAVLAELRTLGVRMALDDFGTGYSSLGFLDVYQMDTLKIDRSFVARMLTRPRTMAIVETILRLGHALDLSIVAEGVEDEAQLRALQSRGCDLVQGFHLGRPMTVGEVEAVLATRALAGTRAAGPVRSPVEPSC